jgi:hypothetical protein
MIVILVVYHPLYGKGVLWVRPLDMFVERVELADNVCRVLRTRVDKNVGLSLLT